MCSGLRDLLVEASSVWMPETQCRSDETNRTATKQNKKTNLWKQHSLGDNTKPRTE
jgi:hypothetical protein